MTDYGLFPDIWGPHAWEFLHSVAYAYPINPTKLDIKNYKTFYSSLQHVLPCIGCKKSYGSFITNKLLLDDSVLKNRDSLTKWLFDLHEEVNKKLGKTYNVTYDEINNKYNNYRMKNNMDLNDVAVCYKSECKKEVPYLNILNARKIKKYAKSRGIDDFEVNIEKINNLKKESLEWDERTKKCRDIISNMKINSINNIEKFGEYKNLPTVEELQLMSNLCTTISEKSLLSIIDIINNVKENKSDTLFENEGRCTDCSKGGSVTDKFKIKKFKFVSLV